MYYRYLFALLNAEYIISEGENLTHFGGLASDYCVHVNLLVLYQLTLGSLNNLRCRCGTFSSACFCWDKIYGVV